MMTAMHRGSAQGAVERGVSALSSECSCRCSLLDRSAVAVWQTVLPSCRLPQEMSVPEERWSVVLTDWSRVHVFWVAHLPEPTAAEDGRTKHTRVARTRAQSVDSAADGRGGQRSGRRGRVRRSAHGQHAAA